MTKRHSGCSFVKRDLRDGIDIGAIQYCPRGAICRCERSKTERKRQEWAKRKHGSPPLVGLQTGHFCHQFSDLGRVDGVDVLYYVAEDIGAFVLSEFEF